MENQTSETVQAIQIIGGEFDAIICGKCRSVLESGEVDCPVCGAENDVENAIEKSEKAVFSQK